MPIAVLLLAVASALPTTPPSTWAKTGPMQFKWGMGAGDVQVELAAPGAILKSSGRLELKKQRPGDSDRITRYEIGSTPFDLAGAPMDAIYLSFFDGAFYELVLFPSKTTPLWCLKVASLLSDKYGDPALVRSNHWLWQQESTTISLACRSEYMLTYSSRVLSERAQAEAERARDNARTVRDAADKTKL